MTTENISLFRALNAKMGFLDQRQRVIAQNVANADTPGYQPNDLKPVDFGRILKNVTGDVTVRPATTNAKHMPSPQDLRDPEADEQEITYEVAPAGNAVIMEEQMVSASRTVADYNLMTALYQKNVNMIRTALGRGGQ